MEQSGRFLVQDQPGKKARETQSQPVKLGVVVHTIFPAMQ
jgi:hypothetical protein